MIEKRLGAMLTLLLSAWTGDVLAAEASDVEKFVQAAYPMAVAAECTYHGSGLLADQQSPQRCLRGRQLIEFDSLADADVYSWLADNSRCGLRTGIDGYLLINTRDAVILAIRGTQPPFLNPATDESVLHDWLSSFKAVPIAEGFHSGFQRSWDCIKSGLIAGEGKRFLDTHLSESKKFLITGHSKGGAIAIIAAVKAFQNELAPLRTPDAVYAFEAARPLTQETARKFAGKLLFLWRLEYKADIVSLVPPGEEIRARHEL